MGAHRNRVIINWYFVGIVAVFTVCLVAIDFTELAIFPRRTNKPSARSVIELADEHLARKTSKETVKIRGLRDSLRQQRLAKEIELHPHLAQVLEREVGGHASAGGSSSVEQVEDPQPAPAAVTQESVKAPDPVPAADPQPAPAEVSPSEEPKVVKRKKCTRQNAEGFHADALRATLTLEGLQAGPSIGTLTWSPLAEEILLEDIYRLQFPPGGCAESPFLATGLEYCPFGCRAHLFTQRALTRAQLGNRTLVQLPPWDTGFDHALEPTTSCSLHSDSDMASPVRQTLKGTVERLSAAWSKEVGKPPGELMNWLQPYADGFGEGQLDSDQALLVKHMHSSMPTYQPSEEMKSVNVCSNGVCDNGPTEPRTLDTYMEEQFPARLWQRVHAAGAASRVGQPQGRAPPYDPQQPPRVDFEQPCGLDRDACMPHFMFTALQTAWLLRTPEAHAKRGLGAARADASVQDAFRSMFHVVGKTHDEVEADPRPMVVVQIRRTDKKGEDPYFVFHCAYRPVSVYFALAAAAARAQGVCWGSVLLMTDAASAIEEAIVIRETAFDGCPAPALLYNAHMKVAGDQKPAFLGDVLKSSKHAHREVDLVGELRTVAAFASYLVGDASSNIYMLLIEMLAARRRAADLPHFTKVACAGVAEDCARAPHRVWVSSLGLSIMESWHSAAVRPNTVATPTHVEDMHWFHVQEDPPPPQYLAPEDTRPDEARLEEAPPEDARPEEASPDEPRPEEAPLEDARPEEAPPEEPSPEEARPEEASPEEARPEEASPEEAHPKEVGLEEMNPPEAQAAVQVAVLPEFAERAAVQRAARRFQARCSCINARYLQYVREAYPHLEARGGRLQPSAPIPPRGLLVDHSEGMFVNGLGNNLPWWRNALRLGPGVGRAVYVKYAAACNAFQCSTDPSLYFNGYFVDWHWHAEQEAALAVLEAQGDVAHLRLLCRAGRSTPPLQLVLEGSQQRWGGERLGEAWFLAALREVAAAHAWLVLHLCHLPSVLDSGGGLEQDPFLKECPAEPKGCEGLRSLYPAPALQTAMAPVLRQMDKWQGYTAVHLRTGWVDHVDKERAVESSRPHEGSCASADLIAALDHHLGDCKAEAEQRSSMCVMWHDGALRAPLSEDLKPRCPGATGELRLPPELEASIPPAHSNGTLGLTLHCAYRFAAAHAGGDEWGVFVIGDTPAFIKAMARDEAVRNRVVSTLDAVSLGGTSFNRKTCDLQRQKCDTADDARIHAIRLAAVVDVTVAGFADTALSVPGSSFIKAGAAGWTLLPGDQNGEDWGFAFAGEIKLDQGQGVKMSQWDVEHVLAAPHCHLPERS